VIKELELSTCGIHKKKAEVAKHIEANRCPRSRGELNIREEGL